MVNKIDFKAKNLTSNAGLFLLLENAKSNGIIKLIEENLVFDSASTNKIKMNHIKERRKIMSIEKMWIQGIIRLMDEELKDEDRERILSGCGKNCVEGSGLIDKIKLANLDPGKPDEVFEKLKSPELLGHRITKDDNYFYTFCEECFCPHVKDNIEDIPGSFCECTKGYTKHVLETAFQRPVNVEILQTIIRGADSCRFKSSFIE